jgi:hypothetical protein
MPHLHRYRVQSSHPSLHYSTGIIIRFLNGSGDILYSAYTPWRYTCSSSTSVPCIYVRILPPKVLMRIGIDALESQPCSSSSIPGQFWFSSRPRPRSSGQRGYLYAVPASTPSLPRSPTGFERTRFTVVSSISNPVPFDTPGYGTLPLPILAHASCRPS